jgi:hypothetical protein
MAKYTIWLDEPTNALHVAVKNLGGAVRDKDGLFAVRLWDKDNKALPQSECSLPVSNQLGESYLYVSATRGGDLIRLGIIAASRSFQGIQLQYDGAFTDRPLSPSQLGPLFYTVSDDSAAGQQNYTVTKMTAADAIQEAIQR